MKYLLLFLLLSTITISSFAETREKKSGEEEILRQVRGTFDLQGNTQSNCEFFVTNYGL